MGRFGLGGTMKSCGASLCIVLALLTKAEAQLEIAESEEVFVISRGDKMVLTYHKADVPPPDGADPLYRRSGFIHPLCAPSGKPVTGIHPADHVHHLGLWHAWVNTQHGTDKIDFWNLKKGTGRVRFAKPIVILKDAGTVGFQTRQEHIAYKGENRTPIVILRERFEILARYRDQANVVDYQMQQSNVTATPLQLAKYRYGGGLAYRAPASWNESNSDYLTSEGLDRSNSHQSRARWVAMWGPVGPDEFATLTVLIDPRNHDFPSRLRTWPSNIQKGAIFLNVVPTQETAWEIKPGETITMRYRLIVTDGKPDRKKIEAAWKKYEGEAKVEEEAREGEE